MPSDDRGDPGSCMSGLWCIMSLILPFGIVRVVHWTSPGLYVLLHPLKDEHLATVDKNNMLQLFIAGRPVEIKMHPSLREFYSFFPFLLPSLVFLSGRFQEVHLAEMTASNTAFSVFSGFGIVLSLIPLWWHLQSWNVGTCMFMTWAALGCLVYFVDSIVWRGNVINWAPVWCDIGTFWISSPNPHLS